MNCREFTDFLMAYIDEELPETERRSFEQHIGDCPPCLSYLDSYKDTIRLGKCLCEDPTGPVPDDAPEPLIQAILRARKS